MIPTALLALAVGAPVAVAAPAPAPPAVRDVRVGFRWCFGGLDGATDPNWQSVGRTIREALGP